MQTNGEISSAPQFEQHKSGSLFDANLAQNCQMKHRKRGLPESDITYRTKGEDTYKRFNHFELLYVEGNNYYDEVGKLNRNGVILHFVDGTTVKSCKRFTQLSFLNNENYPYFIKVHRSIYINLHHLYEYAAKYATLKTYRTFFDRTAGTHYLQYSGENIKLPVSKSGLRRIKAAINEL